MVRTVVLRDWDQQQPSEVPRSHRFRSPQYTPRLSGRACRYPNQIRRYRLDHHWTQRDVAARMGCRPATVSSWEHGRSFPQGPKVLRLVRVLDTFVESLYYNHYTAEKFFELPITEPSERVIPLSAPLVLPASAHVVATKPRTFHEWHHQLLTTQFLNDTVRARHQHAVNQEPVWVPIHRAGRMQPHVVPYVQWDGAPAVPKSLLMTAWWIRRYAQAKRKQPPLSTTRLAYENYLTLFTRHEAALKREQKK